MFASKTTITTLSAAVAASLACAPVASDSEPQSPRDGKFDDVPGAVNQGYLEWNTIGGAALGAGEQHIYRIDSPLAGAEFNLLVTTGDDGPETEIALYRGDTLVELAAGLDPVLSGVLDEADIYTVVVRKTGGELGSYDLELDCESLECQFSSEAVELERADLPLPLAQWENDMPDFECWWVGVHAFDYQWDSATTIPDVDRAKWSALFAYKEIYNVSWIQDWDVVPHSGTGALEDLFGELDSDETLESFEDRAGLTRGQYQTTRIDFGFDCAPSVTCFGSATLLLDHEQRRVIAVDVGGADEC